MQNTDIQKYFDNLLKESQDWAKNSLPKIVGREAVAHFKENFDQEGFVDNGLKKWKDVKRRDPSSKWYGFDYKGEKRVSYRFKRDRKTGKTYKVKQQKKLNFSKAATIRKILSGSSGDLRKSIRYIPKSGKVSITSDKPYAYVQNYGGTIKIFGKKTVMLPARQFIGESKELNDKVENIIIKGLDKILNK